MTSTDFPKARSEDLVILTRPDETLVYDMIAGEAHCLNETAAFVWGECSGDASIGEIGRSMGKRFGYSVSDDLVRLAVVQLEDRKLLSGDALNNRPVSSRREAIKKIGLASAVAIPIIASIVVPQNAFGGLSCRACTSPGNCLSRPGCGNFCNAVADCSPFP